MADARIVAFGAASAPTGWLACDGASLLRADEPELFAAIGTTYGSDDADHFNVPDLRARFALGRATSGTGSSLAETGGALGHTHTADHGHTATQPSDHAAHVVTQPATHAAHVVTQPAGHGSLAHTGFGADNHPAASHSGASVDAHSVNKSAAHGKHATDGSHQHDAHSAALDNRSSGSAGLLNMSGKHAAGGGHQHDSHSAHTESVSGHSTSSQGNDHAAQAHSATQPNAHSVGAHAFTVDAHPAHALTVDAHSAHSGAAIGTTTVTLGAGDPPYLTLLFIIAAWPAPTPVGAVFEFGAAAAPSGHVLCNGASLLRASYPDLFAAIGTTYGSADGSHFNVPDLRGRHILGAGGAIALGAAGGAANHTHAGASHGHAVTQPNAHSDHSISSPGHGTHTVTTPAHGALSHAGAAIAAHGSLAHSGWAIGNHSVTQSSGHGTHSSDGDHQHDGHTFNNLNAGGSSHYGGPTKHASGGGHTHNSHSAHSGAALSAHAETQANAHGAASHTVGQPNDHGSLTHAGAALSPHDAHAGAALSSHSAHANAALAAGTSAGTDAAEAPYLAVSYIIRTTTGTQPLGSLYGLGQATAPAGTLLAHGQAISRTTYADLWTLYGTTWGAGDGSSTFNLPDLRGRIPRGANGDLAASGGALDHAHAIAATHAHAATQPDAHAAHSTTQPGPHADHTATQPNDHASLTHGGATVGSHSLSHSGASIAVHSATQADDHPAHTTAGSHDHDAHTFAGAEGTGAFVTLMYSPTNHAAGGSHDHSGDGAHNHSGFGVDAHSVNQANTHSLTHSVNQPDAHGGLTHAGFGVNAHGAHSGFGVDAHGAHAGFSAIAGGTGTTSTANPPFVVLEYAVQALVDTFYQDRTVEFAGQGELEITAYTVELAAVSTTAPSSPLLFILEAPE